jgi:glucose-6-phosphate dehydrogenase assembly protein OpcA
MAGPVGEATWRASSPESVEADLAAVWREVAGRAKPIARAVMSNLIVVRDQTASPSSTRTRSDRYTLDEVSACHPSRVIVITHDEGRNAARDQLAARVGVLTFGPPEARYGVEQIAVQSACAEAALPSIVRRLVRGDLPTSIWWRADLSRVPLVEPLVSMGRQLVYDSRRWTDVPAGVLAMGPLLADRSVDIADLNWRRLAPVRQALAHAGEWLTVDDLCRSTVRVVHRAGDEAIAWLFVGWVSARLEWKGPSESRVEKADSADDVLRVSVKGSRTDIDIVLTPHTVQLRYGDRPPMSIGVPPEGEADAVASELRALARDGCLHDALSALALRFRAEGLFSNG